MPENLASLAILSSIGSLACIHTDFSDRLLAGAIVVLALRHNTVRLLAGTERRLNY